MLLLSQIAEEETIIHLDVTGKCDLVSLDWVLMKLYEDHCFSNEKLILGEVRTRGGLQIKGTKPIVLDVSKKCISIGTECMICRTLYEDDLMDCPNCSEEDKDLVSGTCVVEKFYINKSL
ncbi:hypothetical protein YDYSY3_39210 [Paenibacillus chitinolyticus]|nr:hypothetical protein YDYSY3_39210 [Paenibacillus chitinolyticus]